MSPQGEQGSDSPNGDEHCRTKNGNGPGRARTAHVLIIVIEAQFYMDLHFRCAVISHSKSAHSQENQGALVAEGFKLPWLVR